MSKKRSLCKLLAIILLSTGLCGAFTGCDRPAAGDTVDRFFSFLQNKEYPRIYQLLTAESRKNLSLVDFSSRYEEIYKTISLQKAVCKLTGIRKVNEDNSTATFTMTATTAKLGVFTMNMEANLRWENSKWLLNWTSELILPGLETGDKALLRVLSAERGAIFDANGEVLARNGFAQSVYVDTSKVKNYETTVRLLAPKVGMTETGIRKLLDAAMKKTAEANAQDDTTVPPEAAGVSETGSKNATPVPTTPSPSPSTSPSPSAPAGAGSAFIGIMKVIKAYPQGTLTDSQKQELLAIPGVGIDDTSMTKIRIYPYGDLLAQTLGYTSVMTADDLTNPEFADLPQDAVVGKLGLEKAFDKQLRGKDGYELFIVDGNGTRKTTLAQRTATNGSDLRLTIDIKLQQSAEMLLRQHLTEDMGGSVVVLDPKTGFVQALASAPSFDPNIYSFPLSPDMLSFLNDKTKTPTLNRATLGRYPPGSTFKPFTASMGLTDGVISTSTVFPYEVKNNYWTPTDDNWAGPPIKRKDYYSGPMNLQNAITYSDNIFFAYVAMKVGGAKFYQHCLDLGFTEKLNFDLPLKTSMITRSGAIDNLRLLADSGYGQGELWITPVQMASLFGSLANGGDIMLPRLVKSICRSVGTSYLYDNAQPEVWKKGVIPGKNLRILLPNLKRVASIGTARALNVSSLKQYEICAKTGTAEIGTDKSREIAWLIGFTTKERDRLVCVTVEVPAGKGGSVRTDIAKGMFKAEPSPTGLATDKENKDPS